MFFLVIQISILKRLVRWPTCIWAHMTFERLWESVIKRKKKQVHAYFAIATNVIDLVLLCLCYTACFLRSAIDSPDFHWARGARVQCSMCAACQRHLRLLDDYDNRTLVRVPAGASNGGRDTGRCAWPFDKAWCLRNADDSVGEQLAHRSEYGSSIWTVLEAGGVQWARQEKDILMCMCVWS